MNLVVRWNHRLMQDVNFCRKYLKSTVITLKTEEEEPITTILTFFLRKEGLRYW